MQAGRNVGALISVETSIDDDKIKNIENENNQTRNCPPSLSH